MSKEVKIGVFTFIVLLTMIWGYTFLKGRNLLSPATILYTTYDDVTDLTVSSPVTANGYKIGTVTKILLNPNDVKKMDVYFLIDGDFKIPKNAVAVQKSLGVVAGKGISISFDKACTGPDCAKNGDKLIGRKLGFFDALVGEEELSEYGKEISLAANQIMKNLGAEGQEGSLHEIIRNLEKITEGLNRLTNSTSRMIDNSGKDLERTLNGLADITTNIAKNNKKIDGIISNLDKLSADLSNANLAATAGEAKELFSSSKIAVDELKSTMISTKSTINEMKSVITKMDSGDGSMAKLINDKKLYENLSSTSGNLNLLLQDLRLNPKRYAHFSLFGKKNAQYTSPEEDPANK